MAIEVFKPYEILCYVATSPLWWSHTLLLSESRTLDIMQPRCWTPEIFDHIRCLVRCGLINLMIICLRDESEMSRGVIQLFAVDTSKLWPFFKINFSSVSTDKCLHLLKLMICFSKNMNSIPENQSLPLEVLQYYWSSALILDESFRVIDRDSSKELIVVTTSYIPSFQV